MRTGLREQIDFQIQNGIDGLVPGRHHRRIADARFQRARPRDRTDREACQRARAGHRRHRRQCHQRSAGTCIDIAKQVGRGRLPVGQSVLQQAEPGRVVSPFHDAGRRGRSADRAVQHPRPHRHHHVAADGGPAGRSIRNIVAIKEATGSLDMASEIMSAVRHHRCSAATIR